MGVRLNKVLSELNIGLQTAVDFLKAHQELGEIRDDANPNTKIWDSQYEALVKEFKGDENNKSNAEQLFQLFPRKSKENIASKTKVLGKTDFDSINQNTRLEEIASPLEDTSSVRRMVSIEKTAHVEEVEPATENERKQYLTKKEVLVRVHEIAQGEDMPQKEEIDYLKTAFYKIHIAEREAAFKEYLDGGGNPELYQFTPDPEEEALKAELGIIKEKRLRIFKEQERVNQENLQKMVDIIEKIRAMMTTPEEANKSYREFKLLQEEWKKIKDIPGDKANELRRKHQIYVENYYDLRRIFKEQEKEKQEELKTKFSEAAQQGATVNVCDKRYDVFVSYSRKDSSRVQIIVNELQIKGYKIWIDKDGIESGDAFKKVIVNAIKKADVFLFFSSIDANKSSWTVKEVDVAVHLKKVIVPVKLDDSEYDDSVLFDLAGLDFIDLSNEASHAYAVNKLDKALKKKINKPKV